MYTKYTNDIQFLFILKNVYTYKNHSYYNHGH